MGAVTVTQRGEQATLAIQGEIDLSNAVEFRDQVMTCLAEGVTDLTVDMTDLDFIDCAGISSLAVAMELLSEHGQVVVRNTPRRARMIIEISGMADAMTIENEEPQKRSIAR
jgi:anti-sigma B factor antagonist